MSVHVHRFLPTTGDSRGIVGSGPITIQRAPGIDYLAQVARAADQLGFGAVLTPTGTWCEDSWPVTAALSRVTRHLKFLVAFRPGLLSPTFADRSEDAWAVTDRMLEAVSDDVISLAQRQFLRSESAGQQRIVARHGGSRDNLVASPKLWADFGFVRSGVGTALVGSHREAADRLAEYHQPGIDHCILSGQPQLEEAYWFAEGVLPRLESDGLLGHRGPGVSPAGVPRARLRPGQSLVTSGAPRSLVAVSSGDSATSKTRALASAALDLGGGGQLIDLVELPADGLLGRRQDARVDQAVALASAAAVLVLATPIYRATYNGTIKAFLDRFGPDALYRTAVVWAGTAAAPAHFLALDTGGRAVVASLKGWTVPTVVYATAADFTEGRPSEPVLETLRTALGEAQTLASVLRA